ncbi:MAG: sulfide-dependent adenosine diphosphate thiazole synthase [Treponema sp.]|nr:sulfide-dependent adenosine diphosphate thiazole synthase [Treponema sp.]
MLEYTISEKIADSYFAKFKSALNSDAIIIGAGPSGLICSYFLARKGYKVTICERKLTPGGGVWGGGMFFNNILVQEEAARILQEMEIPLPAPDKGFYTIDAVFLASTLISRAVGAGVTILNMISAEDVVFAADDSVAGVVLNWTPVQRDKMSVDPLMAVCKCVLDATGHPAEVVNTLLRKNSITLKTGTGKVMGERSLKVRDAEEATVGHTGEVYPRLFVSGMAANAVYGAYRMGPVFGGMIRSGKKAADLMEEVIKGPAPVYS